MMKTTKTWAMISSRESLMYMKATEHSKSYYISPHEEDSTFFFNLVSYPFSRKFKYAKQFQQV